MSWDLLIDETELAKMLPLDYAHFARPVKEGLVVFLSGLPAADQEQIFSEQASLSSSATLAERLGLLARSCPVLHKLGQVLAREPRLAAELRDQFRPLESLPPTVSLTAIEEILTQEFGARESRGITLLPPAIAEASVAVVIPYRNDRDPTAGDGVLKILKPGIEERMQLELELLGRVGVHLDLRCDDLSIPHLDYRETFEQVREKLRVEIFLTAEQQHLAEARAVYADEPDVQIPRLFEHCTPRVTAMERVFGVQVTDHALNSHGSKQRLARLMMRALLAKPMFSQSHWSMFHADPHAGNLLYTRDGRLAILDWSLVGHLGETERVLLGQMMLAAVSLRGEALVKMMAQLDERGTVDESALRHVVGQWLRRIRRGQFPGLTWFVGLLDDATTLARLRVAADLMLFRKTLHMLEGVIGELGADGFRIEDAMQYEFALQFGMEWPRRWLAPLDSRRFATRLSNLDIAECIWRMPFTAARYLQGELEDAMR